MNRFRNKTRMAEAGLLLATVIWGSAFVVVKDAAQSISPSYMISIRFGIAFLLMCIVFFRKLKNIRLTDLAGGAVIGLFSMLGFEFQTVGVQYTTAGNNAFLTSVYCVIVPFLYWAVRHRRPKLQNVAAAFLCIAGVGLLSVKQGFSIGFGDLLSLLCGLCFAFQIVAIDIYTEKSDPILLTILQSGACAIFALPVALATEHAPSGMQTQTVLSLLYLAIFSTMIAFVLQMVCQKYMDPSKASLIMAMESVFGTIFGITLLGESLAVQTFFGFLLIFAAVFLSEINPQMLKKHRKVRRATRTEKTSS